MLSINEIFEKNELKLAFFDLKEYSRKIKLIKEKRKFAEQFIMKSHFISSLKKFYIQNQKNKKKLAIAHTMYAFQLKKKLFEVFSHNTKISLKKRNSILLYAYNVFIFFIIHNLFKFKLINRFKEKVLKFGKDI